MPEEKIQFTPHQDEDNTSEPRTSVRGAGFTNQPEQPAPEGQPASPEQAENLVKSFEETGEKGGRMSKGVLIFFSFLVVFLGMSTGFFLARRKGAGIQRSVGEEGVKKGMMVGVLDEKTFRDAAEGMLKEGGVNGEGSHHLERPGGKSQNVYLTSSIVDLDQFVGRTVKVWGETFAAQKAGWLMDVGKLEVLE